MKFMNETQNSGLSDVTQNFNQTSGFMNMSMNFGREFDREVEKDNKVLVENSIKLKDMMISQ